MDFLLIYEDGPLKVCNELTPSILEEHEAQIVTIVNTAFGAVLRVDMDWEEIDVLPSPPVLVDRAKESAPTWFYPHRAQDVKLEDNRGAWMNRDTSKVIRSGGRASGKTVANMPPKAQEALIDILEKDE